MRHKRQALQDMARPLKQWLYKHRDNPYPTKTEKILLALGSHMTLVQVRSKQAKLILDQVYLHQIRSNQDGFGTYALCNDIKTGIYRM